jgi:hypothetical protein
VSARRWASARGVALGSAGLLALLAVWAMTGSPVAAAQPPIPLTPTGLSVMSLPSTVVVGSKVTIQLRLTTPDGTPVLDGRVLLYLDGNLLRSDRSDQNGLVNLDLRTTETTKAHTASLLFEFVGDRTHAASKLSQNLTIAAAALKVTTVPAVPGLRMTLGTISATTAANGIATFLVPDVGSYLLTPNFDLGSQATSRVSFLRWQDGVFTPARSIHVTGDMTLVLGLRVAVESNVRLVDQDGNSIPAANVDSVTLSSSDGQNITLTSFDSLWWISAVATSKPDGLEAVTTVYRVSAVMIAGTNVVNSGQTTWTPSAGGTLTIPVLLYQLQVSTRDAFFGWPLTGPLDLVYPDGSTAHTVLGSSGNVDFGSLPRGQYLLHFHTQGLSPATPVALSRSQTALLRIITYLDIGVAVGILLLIGIALLVLGRRHQLVHLYGQAYGRARDAAVDPRPTMAVQRVGDGFAAVAAVVDRSLGLDPWHSGLGPTGSTLGRLSERLRAVMGRFDAALERLVARGSSVRRISFALDERVEGMGRRRALGAAIAAGIILLLILAWMALTGAGRPF